MQQQKEKKLKNKKEECLVVDALNIGCTMFSCTLVTRNALCCCVVFSQEEAEEDHKNL